MRVGYIRVSTAAQHTERQEDGLKELNVERIFMEKVSGKDRNRPQLKAMMAFVQPGDTVVVHELSRLGRSVVDLYDIAKELKEKGVGLESMKESIDLSCATGNLTFGILAVIAQFERELIRERQKEGLDAAKARGKTWGQKKRFGLDERLTHDVMRDYSSGAISWEEAARRLATEQDGAPSRETVYKLYRKWKLEQEQLGNPVPKRKKYWLSKEAKLTAYRRAKAAAEKAAARAETLAERLDGDLSDLVDSVDSAESSEASVQEAAEG